MGASYVRVPQALLFDRQISTSSKVVWMALQLETPLRAFTHGTGRICITRLAARAGVSRPTVYKAIRELSAAGWLPYPGPNRPESAWISFPAYLITDSRLDATSKLFYGMLKLKQGRLRHQLKGKPLTFTYSLLSKVFRWHRKTIAKAVRTLAHAGWLRVLRKNHRRPAHGWFKDPRLTPSEVEVTRIKRRLLKAPYLGEALMREYLSLLIDSDDYEDNAAPGFLVNPLTEERLQLDRYYPPGVAFEFNGPQHYGPTDRFTAKEAADQRVRDLIKTGICAQRGIQLKIVHAQDLTLSRMKKLVGKLLPLRDLSFEGPRIAYLESVARSYRRKAQQVRFPDFR